MLCIGVIQLIPSYQRVIEELARVTKPEGTVLIQTLHRGSIQRKLVNLYEQNKKFDKMYGMDELEKVYRELGLGRIEFLKMYHPFSFVRISGEAGSLTDFFCTTFAIKGSKRIG